MIFICRLVYKPGAFPDGYPGFLYGDGDGTVNIHSLEGCLNWQGKQEKKIYHQTFSSLDHMGILRDERVLSYLLSLITNL
jgi:lysophospholipase-3